MAPFMIIGMLASLSVLPMVLIPRVTPLLKKGKPLAPWHLIALTPTGVMGTFVSGLAVSAVYSLVPLYLQRNGYESDQVGQLMAVIVLGALLLQYPVGRWSDRHDRQLVLIVLGAFCTLIAAAIVRLPLTESGLAGLLFLLGGGVFSLYPVAVGHAADRAPAGALVRMSQGLLLISALGSIISPPVIASVMAGSLGDAGLFWSLGVLGLLLVLFFIWRRSVRPAPQPVAPLTATKPFSSAGAELVVTDELIKGATQHEYFEDLSGAVPDVEVAEPLAGPPREGQPCVDYDCEDDEGDDRRRG